MANRDRGDGEEGEPVAELEKSSSVERKLDRNLKNQDQGVGK